MTNWNIRQETKRKVKNATKLIKQKAASVSNDIEAIGGDLYNPSLQSIQREMEKMAAVG
jgi:hypothetical protein